MPNIASMALVLALACSPSPGRTADDISVRLDEIRAGLDQRAAAALDCIAGLDRQLLAARAYLRAGASLASRWSWTDAEIEAWAGSPDQARLEAELALVRLEFERANPGYTLYVNPEVRSLELQFERWNSNESVGVAAVALLDSMRKALNGPAFTGVDPRASHEAFRRMLQDAVLEVPANLAAPGLSAHGRMSAVDFQVQRGDEIVAGTESGEIAATWEAQGWTRRLKAAVTTATRRFEGPLRQPYEPWHYDYVP